MTNPKARVEIADKEAAAWHVRLGGPDVGADAIKDFFTWRQEPVNADAYRRVEKIWADTGKLTRDPEVQEAFDAALFRRKGDGRARRLPRTLIGLGAIGAAIALAFGAYAWWGGRDTFATDIGEQRLVQLADGSSVRLDTASQIRVRFDGHRRVVELERGQALFTVAHDAQRPFQVEAGGTQVTAVGTVFDVRRDEAGVQVVLVKGIVDVAASGEGGRLRRMTPGQLTRVTKAGATTISPADLERATSWSDGRLVFRDTPLRQAVAEMNRYLTDPITLDAPTKENETVNGVFRTGDRDAFVSAASAVFDLQASPRKDGAVHLSAENN